EALGSRGYLLLIDINIVKVRYARAIKIPGIAPARNISPTDNFDNQAIIIMTLLGGIITPTTEAEAFNAAENEEGYPFFFISGINTPPTAAASAAADPDTPAIPIFVTTETAASPPGNDRTNESAKLIIRFATPPIFILMGSIMEHGGVAKRMINLADSLVRSLPGGLAAVSVVTNMGMAGVSGSAAADAAAVGGVLMPEMKKKGYPSSLSVALNASASVVGVIIPPSSVIIIIAWLSKLSVGEMFLAGAIPGILIALAYLTLTIFISIKRRYPREPRASLKEIGTSFLSASLT